ncbi:MAG: hypothetical protein FWG70_08020 [Oscillospiraceae bacterium]|nr:hypothetical protein [Oscillospiraceae bacterium]
MKKWLKWAFLVLFVSAGAWASIIAPQATLSMLPEVETTSLKQYKYRELVRGAGLIYNIEERCFLTAAVREKDINAVKIGQPAELYGAAIGDGEYKAVVLEIADFARQTEVYGVTETVVDVVLEVVNHKEFIRSGYTAEVIIEVGEPRDLLLIPYEVINQDERGEYTLVLAGNTALRRELITGLELAEGAELLAGVREGDELIINPEQFAENMLVKSKS